MMISRASIVRAFLIPCAMTLVLAGCSAGQNTNTSTAGKPRIPSICKKFASSEDQQTCAGRWQVAQDECKREEAANKATKNPTQKFSMSKCITKKMNLASAASKTDRTRATGGTTSTPTKASNASKAAKPAAKPVVPAPK